MRNKSPRSRARRAIKQKISRLKSCKKSLPRLVDCSQVYGDNSFTNDDYARIDKEIGEAEQELKQFDIDNPSPQQHANNKT